MTSCDPRYVMRVSSPCGIPHDFYLHQRWKEWLKPYCKNTKGASKRSPHRHGFREVFSLSVNIVEAKQLADRISSGSVYCQLGLNELPVARTQLKESLSPVWDEEFLIS